LITSAPRSPRICAQNGPASTRDRSTTLNPVSAPTDRLFFIMPALLFQTLTIRSSDAIQMGDGRSGLPARRGIIRAKFKCWSESCEDRLFPWLDHRGRMDGKEAVCLKRGHTAKSRGRHRLPIDAVRDIAGRE